MKIGIIPARLQIDELHTGHRYLLEQVKEKNDKVVVLLGCSVVKNSLRNPLDFETRKAMILGEYPDFIVLPLHDNKSDEIWSENLDKLVADISWELTSNVADWEVALYHSRDSFRSYYTGDIPCVELDAVNEDNGTIVRELIGKSAPINSREFRQGVIYTSQKNYPKVNAVVDMFVYNHETGKVLLGRRKDEKNWRLFGGFSDPSDLSFKHTAQRELKEESGLDIPIGNFECIDSFQIDDWRFRNDRDKIITTLFWCDCDPELPDTAKGDDDINEVAWFDIRDVFATVTLPFIDGGFNTVEEHAILIQAAYEHWLEISNRYG